MKKIIMISAVVLIIVLVGALIWFLLTDKKEVADTSQKVQFPSGEKLKEVVPPTEAGIIVDNLKDGDIIQSPLKITGRINGGGWSAFEAQAGTVEILDNQNKKISSDILKTTTDWTKLPVSFEANLKFASAADQSGTLVFHNENPSGLPDKNKEFRLAVKIVKNQ